MSETKYITYEIPTHKKEVKLSQWIKFEKLTHLEEGEELDEEFIKIKMLEIFCGVEPNDYLLLKQSDINEVITYLNKILTEKGQLINTFNFEGVEYGLIPDFDKHVTAGELIDMDSYLITRDWTRLLSILYRPITYKNGNLYNIEPYDGTHTKFDNLQYDIFEGVMAFFLTLLQQLSKATLSYSLQLVEKMDGTLAKKLNSQLNTVGIQNLFGF